MASKVKNVYIGFAIDMDRAYDTNTKDGRPIRKDHPKYLERCNHKKIFEDGMETLFQYFKDIGAEKGVTWFVNEASFMTTKKFPEILKKCINTGGEIGLHTHFNSAMFKSSTYTMPENPARWEKEGLIEPKKRLEDFLKKHDAKQKKITVFKAGNHIRNKVMFEKIVEHGFEIDTTCQIKEVMIKEINDQYRLLFNDINIEGNGFFYKTINGEIFEIPEIGGTSIGRIKFILNNNNPRLIRIQMHPWQVLNLNNSNKTLLDVVNNCIEYIKSLNINIEYINCVEMKKICLDIHNKKIYKNINTNNNLDNLTSKEFRTYILKYQYNLEPKLDELVDYFYPISEDLYTFLDKIRDKKKNIYIGINVDLDAAVNDKINSRGESIRDDHPKKPEKTRLMHKFITETNILIDFFNHNKCEKGVTWYVNEPAYHITTFFPDLLKKCIIDGGELGLHSHLNSKIFNSTRFTMSKDKNDWLKKGLIEPINSLEKFYKKKILCYKGGNHIRCQRLYEELVKLGILYDNTKVIDDGRWKCNGCGNFYISEKVKRCKCISDGITLYNDTSIKIGSEPFFIKTDYGGILEIPEIRGDYSLSRVEKHVKYCFENNKLCFILLQTHPYDYKIQLPIIRKTIKKCNYVGNIHFITSNKMAEIYEKELLKNVEYNIVNNYKNIFLNDLSSHYKKMIESNRIFGQNDIFVIMYIYKNFNKSTSCLDLFAGIGQSAIALFNLGFKNVGLLEFLKYRVNLSRKICTENNYNIDIIYDDFFKNKDIFNYDLIFTNNAFNSILDTDIDSQIQIYKKFLHSDKKKTFIFNIEKYGEKKTTGHEIVKNLEGDYNITYIGNNFVQITNYKNKVISIRKISNFFTDFNVINNKNIDIDTVEEDDTEISINIYIDKNLENHKSFGIYYKFPLKFLNKYNYLIPIQKYKFSFFARSNTICKLKIYTGEKWINIGNKLSKEYQKIEVTEVFNFVSKSTYRIGVQNINDIHNCSIYIKNPTLEII